MLNVTILMGRLTKDPETRSTTSGTTVCNFSIAVDRRFKKDGQPPADFFNIVTFSKTAEFVAKYFTKGQLVAVSGTLQNRTWDDADGKKRYATDIIADEVHFAESKKDKNEQAITDHVPTGQFEPVPDDSDLPF